MDEKTSETAFKETLEEATSVSGNGIKDSNRGSSWWSLFSWASPTSTDRGAESERHLFEMHGELSFNNDRIHVQSRLVHLPPRPSKAEVEAEREDASVSVSVSVSMQPPQRYINTLIIDQQDVQGSASERQNVVLCHGFGAGLGFFYRNLAPLSRQVPNSRIFAVDLLGMGRSGRPPFPKFQANVTTDASLAIDFFLDALEQWRQQQEGLERFVLLGHSMGGYLAALYALRHPQRVSRLLLASPVGLPEKTVDGVFVTGHRMPSWMASLWDNNYTPQGLIRALGPLGPRFAFSYVNRRFGYLSPPARAALGDYFYHISASAGSGEYALAALLAPGAWAREPLHSRLPQLSMPVTFIYGANDWMDRTHAEQAAASMTVPVKILSVPEAGHHLHMDNPDEFTRIVASEIAEATATAAATAT